MTTALGTLSWRRFLALVSGLSPNSALCASVSVEAEQPKVISTPEELQRVWSRFIGKR